jgi:hypothetical protein
MHKGRRRVALKESMRCEGKHPVPTKALIALFGLFAEVERDRIAERTKAGLAAAKAKGRRLGRPQGALGHPSSMARKRTSHCSCKKRSPKHPWHGLSRALPCLSLTSVAFARFSLPNPTWGKTAVTALAPMRGLSET